MRDFFKQLFEYNHFHNQEILLTFKNKSESETENSFRIFNHVIHAHHTWNSRILNKKSVYAIWDLRPLRELEEIEEDNFITSIKILQELDLKSNVKYINSKGVKFSNELNDILFHIINHSTYHRGQIAKEFRRTGSEPLVSDYIFYKRR